MSGPPAPGAWPPRAARILADWRWAAGAFLLYAALHAAIRFALSPALGFDDAEQELFAQSLEGGYGFAQPPLYTWILIAAKGALGNGLAAHALVRHGLQFLFLLFMWLAARRLCDDPRTAALATLSYLLLYTFAFYGHHDLTHTTLLAAAVAACAHFYLRAVEGGRAADFACLGAAAAAGLLGKYSFAVLALAALVAALSVPEARRRILRPQALLAPLVAALAVAPHLVWLAGHGHDPMAAAGAVFRPSPDGAGWLAAPGVVLLKAAEYLAPFAVLSACILPALFRPRPWRGDDPFGHRLVIARTVAVGFAAVLVAATAMEATHVKARWLHVPFLLLPLLLFARLHGAPPWGRSRALLAAVACVSLLAVAARFAVDAYAPSRCGACRAYLPAAALAETLRERGFEGGTIIAPEHDIAGNLRAHFPGARTLSSRNPGQAGPEVPPGGACLAVWRAAAGGIDPAFAARLRAALSLDSLPAHGTVSAPMVGAPEREVALSYVLVPGAGDACR